MLSFLQRKPVLLQSKAFTNQKPLPRSVKVAVHTVATATTAPWMAAATAQKHTAQKTLPWLAQGTRAGCQL